MAGLDAAVVKCFPANSHYEQGVFIGWGHGLISLNSWLVKTFPLQQVLRLVQLVPIVDPIWIRSTQSSLSQLGQRKSSNFVAVSVGDTVTTLMLFPGDLPAGPAASENEYSPWKDVFQKWEPLLRPAFYFLLMQHHQFSGKGLGQLHARLKHDESGISTRKHRVSVVFWYHWGSTYLGLDICGLNGSEVHLYILNVFVQEGPFQHHWWTCPSSYCKDNAVWFKGEQHGVTLLWT